MASVIADRHAHRVVKNRAAFGLFILYLGVFAAFATRHQWTRALSRPLPADTTTLARMEKEVPVRRRVTLDLSTAQRTDVFRQPAGMRTVGTDRYWGLPVGKLFLLVRADPYQKMAASLSGVLTEPDADDRKAMEDIDWLTLYRRAKVPETSRARLIPYVFVVPYRPAIDVAILVAWASVCLVGLVATLLSGRRGRQAESLPSIRLLASRGLLTTEGERLDVAWEEESTNQYSAVGSELRIARDWIFGATFLDFFAVPLTDLEAVGERRTLFGSRLVLYTRGGEKYEIRMSAAEFPKALACLAQRAPYAFAKGAAA